jgi:hypothetical protein
MSDQQPEYLTDLCPEDGLLIALDELEKQGNELTLDQVIRYFTILDEALEIADDMHFVVAQQAVVDLFQLPIHLSIGDAFD